MVCAKKLKLVILGIEVRCTVAIDAQSNEQYQKLTPTFSFTSVGIKFVTIGQAVGLGSY